MRDDLAKFNHTRRLVAIGWPKAGLTVSYLLRMAEGFLIYRLIGRLN